jgi:formyltetrahydrofolate-dependent phosphoribosylglycinamide formyltransferase
VSRVRIAVLASGHGSNLQALLDAFSDREASAEVVLVASNRADAGALERARRAGVATAVMSRDGQDADELIALLRAHQVDLVVLAGYLKQVPDAVIAACRDRILNIHPALLPMFGGPGMYGRRVHEAVLASGVRVSGATVHLVDEQYDHGRILAQWPVPVHEGDTPETLAARVLEVEHRLLPAAVRAYGRQLTGGGGSPPALSLAAESFGPAAALPSSFDHALTNS